MLSRGSQTGRPSSNGRDPGKASDEDGTEAFRLWPRRRPQLTSKGQYDPEVTITRGVESRATPGLRERTAESGEQDGYVPVLTGDRTQVRCPGRVALGRSQPHVPLCKMVP